MIQRRQIGPGVTLTCLPSEKWKAGIFSVYLLRPLCREQASLGALLPQVLRRGSRTLPDMGAISAALDELYGAKIQAVTRKRGEMQASGFMAGYVEDAYLPESGIFARLTALLHELLYAPVLENGCFREDYVLSERENLLNLIRSQQNDKQLYAQKRLTALMFPDEPYGVDVLGDEQTAAAITPRRLWDFYQTALADARFEIFYTGSAGADTVAAACGGLRAGAQAWASAAPAAAPPPISRLSDEPSLFTERMDVTQGKLVMGWRWPTPDIHAAQLACSLFGGSPNAKLFVNIREKMSLCYYASSRFDRHKGVMTASSGVAFDQMDAAAAAIRAQWDAVCAGDFSQEELDAARKYLLSALRGAADDPMQLESYFVGQMADETAVPPEQWAEAIASVDAGRIAKAAQSAVLDAVYRLKGEVLPSESLHTS